MIEYPSISGHIIDTHVRVYPKYDGVNVRAKWTRKEGFALFGTRTQLITAATPIYGASVALWKNKYEEAVTEALRRTSCRQAVLFGEFYGPTSFAGHINLEEELDVMLYDATLDNNGLLTQQEFGRLFRGVEIAPILYEGKPNEPLRLKVKAGELEGQTMEGVICKGALDNRGRPVMFKIKSDAWFEQLRIHCAGDEKLYQRLA